MSTLLTLATSAIWYCSARGSVAGALQELPVWLRLLGGALLATEFQHQGVVLAPCLFVLAVRLAMLRAGGQLAGHTASELLRSGSATR